MQNPKENPKQAGRGCFYAIEQEAKKKKQKKAGRNQHLSRFCAIRKKAARGAPLNHPPAQRIKREPAQKKKRLKKADSYYKHEQKNAEIQGKTRCKAQRRII